MSSLQPPIAGLYAIADRTYLKPQDFITAAEAALAGGTRLLQYRDKHSAPMQRLTIAQALNDVCRRHAVPLIINDDIELAAHVGAAGVHLGGDDTDIATARAALGKDTILGLSCYNQLERARVAQAAGADYVAFGRFFASRTKPQAVPATLDLLRAARTELKIPIVAIGGITPENGRSLIEAGADALAVIEGVFNQANIRLAAERYRGLFDTTNK